MKNPFLSGSSAPDVSITATGQWSEQVGGDENHHGCLQKLTLKVVRRKDGEMRFIFSNINPLNEAVLRCYGLFSEVPSMRICPFGGLLESSV